MCKFKFNFLFVLCFITTTTTLYGADEIPTNKNPQPDATEYLTNEKYYTPDGKIHFVGSLIGAELTIFFKSPKNYGGLFFKIRYCLDNLKSKCAKGITICYESMLVKYPKLKDEKMKKMEDIQCDKATDFGIHVYTEQMDEKAKYFVLKSSLDKHFYRFEIPDQISQNDEKRCFELRMGSKDSIATAITDLNGKKLVYVGGPPKKLEPENPLSFFNSDNSNTMNLWMAFLDFVPYYPPHLNLLPRPFTIKGGDKDCKMTAEFDDENINVCKQSREYIGGCQTQFLNSSDLDCQVELSVSESVENERSQQETNTNTDTNTKGEKNFRQHQFEVGAEVRIQAEWEAIIAKWQIEAKIKTNYAHTWGSEDFSETSHSFSTSKTEISALREVKGSGKIITVKVHRTDGGSVSFFQSVLNCGGMTSRYHKVYAVGDTESQYGPQSTVVYQWYEGQTPQQFDYLPSKERPVNYRTGMRQAQQGYSGDQEYIG